MHVRLIGLQEKLELLNPQENKVNLKARANKGKEIINHNHKSLLIISLMVREEGGGNAISV